MPESKGTSTVGRVADRIAGGLAAAERVLSAALLLLVLGTAVSQVFMRYVMKAPLSTSDELARFALVWLAFIAAALAQSQDQHIAVLVLRGTGSRMRQKLMDGLANISALVTGVVMVYLGAETLDRGMRVTSASLEVRMTVVYLSVVLGFLLIAIHAVHNLANLFRFGRANPELENVSLAERQQML